MKGAKLARRTLRVIKRLPVDPEHDLDAPIAVNYMDLLLLISTASTLAEVVLEEHERRKTRLKRLAARM